MRLFAANRLVLVRSDWGLDCFYPLTEAIIAKGYRKSAEGVVGKRLCKHALRPEFGKTFPLVGPDILGGSDRLHGQKKGRVPTRPPDWGTATRPLTKEAPGRAPVGAWQWRSFARSGRKSQFPVRVRSIAAQNLCAERLLQTLPSVNLKFQMIPQ